MEIRHLWLQMQWTRRLDIKDDFKCLAKSRWKFCRTLQIRIETACGSGIVLMILTLVGQLLRALNLLCILATQSLKYFPLVDTLA